MKIHWALFAAAILIPTGCAPRPAAISDPHMPAVPADAVPAASASHAPTTPPSMPPAEHAATANDLADLQNEPLKLTKFVFANKVVDMPLKGRPVTLQVGGEGLVFGQGPVNRFSGHLRLTTDGQCNWAKPLVGTRMAGSPEVMETERQFLGTLGGATHLLRVGDGLRFETADKSGVVEFHP